MSFWEAYQTFAPMRFYELVHILVAVVVGEFFSRKDVSYRFYEHAIAGLSRLAVGVTRVVDVPCEVCANTSVYGPVGVYLEQVPCAGHFVCLGCGDDGAHVFNVHAGLDECDRKETEPRTRTANAEVLSGYRMCSSHNRTYCTRNVPKRKGSIAVQ